MICDDLHHDLSIAARLREKAASECDPEFRRVARYITEMNFRQQKDKMLLPESPLGWSPERLDLAELQYKCFLFLRRKYGKMPPTADIDEFWHSHILDTERYHRDCSAIFGAYHHHYPYAGLRGADDEAQWRKAFDERTQHFYSLEFGDFLYEFGSAG